MSTAEFIDYYDVITKQTYCSVECAESDGSAYENLDKVNYDNYDVAIHGTICINCDESLNNAE